VIHEAFKGRYVFMRRQKTYFSKCLLCEKIKSSEKESEKINDKINPIMSRNCDAALGKKSIFVIFLLGDFFSSFAGLNDKSVSVWMFKN